jgi:hypothetical protein
MALGAVIGTASDFASSADDSQAVAESSSTLDSNLARHVACGPAAAGYVLRIVGAPVRGHELAELSDERGETSLEEIRSFLAARGLAVEPRIMEADELRSWPGIAIVHVSQRNEGHFLVWVGPDVTGAAPRLVDPVLPPQLAVQAVSAGEVLSDAVWTGHVLLVGRSAPIFPWLLAGGGIAVTCFVLGRTLRRWG